MADSASKKYIDSALQEAVLIAFSVKKYGPGLAAAFGAIEAIYDLIAGAPPKPIKNYSTEVAFNDVIKYIDKALDDTAMKNHLAAVTASRDGGDVDQRTLDRVNNDTDFWNDNNALNSLESQVASFHNDLANGELTKTIDWLEARKMGELVASLDLYLVARTNLHRQFHLELELQAIILKRQALKNGNTIPLAKFYETHHPLIDDFCDSIEKAIAHAEPEVTKLEDVFNNRLADARKTAISQCPKPGLARRQAFNLALRQINKNAFVEFTSADRVKNHRLILQAYHKTLLAMEEFRTKKKKQGGKPVYNPLQH